MLFHQMVRVAFAIYLTRLIIEKVSNIKNPLVSKNVLREK